uniref:Uncharacterized protein n=1 Tax=Arundo donax TaxID=35708 RepID=A0A0A9FAR2_ARUDO
MHKKRQQRSSTNKVFCFQCLPLQSAKFNNTPQ